MHTASEEAKPGPSTEPSTIELKQLKAVLESTLGDLVQHEHHKQFMVSALQANKPPPGLTPKINLMAESQTAELSSKVDNILKEAGLQIAHELLEHHNTESGKCKSKAEKLRQRMEECARTAHPSNKQLLTELAVKYAPEAQENAKRMALDLCNKREKRKRDTNTNTLDGPFPKRPRTEINDELRAAILSVIVETKVTDNSITSNTTTHLKTNHVGTINQFLMPLEPSIPKRPGKRRKRQRPRERWQKIKQTNHSLSYREKKYLKLKLLSRNINALSNNIINLSSHTLTNDEISVLGKGVSFIPKPKHVDTDDIKDGIAKLKAQMLSKTE